MVSISNIYQLHVHSLKHYNRERYEKLRTVVTVIDFRHVVDQLAGYSKAVQNFTHVLVRNAGHMVPYDQPKWAFDMISRWISGKDFK